MNFRDFDSLSFDCYGTLIDWETGIAAALSPWAQRRGLNWSSERLVEAHARFETVVQQERPTDSYPDILAETLRRIAASAGVEFSVEDGIAYGASVGEWPAFSDTASALQRLGDRFQLAILSNVDRESIAASNRRLGVEFDLIVTAEDVGSYKPDLANFEFLLRSIDAGGDSTSKLLHVAESMYHDIEPAERIGLPAVWIHRRAGRAGWGATATPHRSVRPRWRFESLSDFADAALA